MSRWGWSASVWLMFLLVLLGGILRPGRREASKESQKSLRVGLVLSVGGRGDRSFNDSAYEGLMQAKALFRSLHVMFSEPRENAAAVRDLENFASQGFDLVIGVGFLMARAVEDVAKRYPKQHFALIDAVVSQPNVASLVFQEHEGSYLAGVLAVLASQTKTVAFLGAMEIPLIRKFEAGFTQGALDTDPSIRVLRGYLGSSPKTFHDPEAGEKMTLTFFGQGADIVFHAAGSSGLGAIKAARTWNERSPEIRKRRYIIGVDGNQDGVSPGAVLTSMIKRVDVAVFEMIKTMLLQRFESRIYRYGLSENGVGVTDCRYAKERLPTDAFDTLRNVRLRILQGQTFVPESPDAVRRSPTSRRSLK